MAQSRLTLEMLNDALSRENDRLLGELSHLRDEVIPALRVEVERARPAMVWRRSGRSWQGQIDKAFNQLGGSDGKS